MATQSMTLFEVLSNDERVIVLSDKENKQFYTWNHSLTLQCWEEVRGGKYTEVDVRTLSETPNNFKAARDKAILWWSAER